MLQNVQATDPLANLTYETSYQPPQHSGRTHTVTLTSRPIASSSATPTTSQGATGPTTKAASTEVPKGILTPKSKKGPKHTVTFAGMLIFKF